MGLVRPLVIAACLLAAPGCGDETSSGVVAGEDRDAQVPPTPEGGAAIDPPAPPELPVCLSGTDPTGCAEPPNAEATPPMLTDWGCPAPFVPRPIGETPWAIDICDAPVVPACPDGQVAWLGDGACGAIGSACPASAFHDESFLRSLAPGFDGAIWYVQAGAAGGDGSAGAPFATVAAALDAATNGDVIALAQGEYAPLAIDKGIALVGACLETVVAGSVNEEAAIAVAAPDASVTNLRVRGPGIGVLFDAGADGASVGDLEVLQATLAGIGSQGAEDVSVDHVVVRDTEVDPVSQGEGFGIAVQGGSLHARQVVLERNTSFGAMSASAGTSLVMHDAVVRDTRSRADGADGGGAAVVDGASLQLSGCVVEANRRYGLASSGGSAVLTSVVVRDTQGSDAEEEQGYGVLAIDGETIAFERCLFEGNRSQSVLVLDTSFVVGEDVAVLGTGVDGDQAGGDAILVDDGTATLVRAILDGSHGNGACATYGGVLSLEDSVVTRTSPRVAGQLARGVVALSEGQTQLSRVRVELTAGTALLAIGTDANLSIRDVTVKGTFSLSDPVHALVGEARNGASLEAARVRVVGHEGALYWRADGAGTRLVVRDSAWEQAGDAPACQGFFGGSGAIAEFTRVAMSGMADMGFGVFGAGTRLRLTDTVVEHTIEGTTGVGVAVATVEGATIEAERVTLRQNASGDVMAIGVGSEVEGESILCEGPDAASGDLTAAGAAAVDGANIVLRKARLIRNPAVATYAASSGALDLSDVLIDDTRSDPDSLEFGMGVIVYDGSEVRMDRCRLERTRGAGVLLATGSASAKLADVVIDEVLPPACASLDASDPRSCSELWSYAAATSGVLAQSQSLLDMRRFEVSRARCGLWLNDASVPVLEHGRIHANRIGVNLRTSAAELEDVIGPTLRFEDNTTNVDSVNFVVPEVPDVSSTFW